MIRIAERGDVLEKWHNDRSFRCCCHFFGRETWDAPHARSPQQPQHNCAMDSHNNTNPHHHQHARKCNTIIFNLPDSRICRASAKSPHLCTFQFQIVWWVVWLTKSRLERQNLFCFACKFMWAFTIWSKFSLNKNNLWVIIWNSKVQMVEQMRRSAKMQMVQQMRKLELAASFFLQKEIKVLAV